GRLAGRWILAFDSNGHGEPAVSGILFIARHNDPAARIGDAIIPKRIPDDYCSIRAARFGGTVGIDDGYGAFGFNVITAGDYYLVKKVGSVARRSVIFKAARDPRVIRAVTGWVGSHFGRIDKPLKRNRAELLELVLRECRRRREVPRAGIGLHRKAKHSGYADETNHCYQHRDYGFNHREARLFLGVHSRSTLECVHCLFL